MHLPRVFIFVSLAVSVLCGFSYAIDVTKSQYDLGCTGANTAETILTPANVNSTTFGKLFTKTVDGQVYAQPLFLQNFSIGGGVHNVVIVCTENNSVYAFDADSGSAAAFWHRSLPTPQTLSCVNLQPTVGITATPVIDRAAGAIFVQAATYESSVYYQKLFAINLTTGSDLNTPVILRDTVSGTDSGTTIRKIPYDALLHFCRPGMLLLNGKIYMGSGSHCDNGDYHGWLFEYNESLTLIAAFCTTPNGFQGSIWQYGGGISSDGTNIFCCTGNGTFNAATSTYGMCAMKFDTNLNVLSYFAPYNLSSLNSNDYDLCSSAMLIPGTSLCTVQGKAGSIYLMKKDSLGGFHSSGDSIVQRFDNAYAPSAGGGNPVSVFWNNLFYLWAAPDSLKVYSFNGTKLSTTLQSSNPIRQSGNAGSISLSANGDTNGILWGTNTSTGRVYAFNASKVSVNLWNSGQAAAKRDTLGSAVLKYARPIVANGKLYVPTTNSLVVYGLLPGAGTIGGTPQSVGTALANNFRVTRNSISLAFSRGGRYEISVSDLQGRIVAKAKGSTDGGDERISMPGTGLQPGTYIAIVDFEQHRMTLQAILAQ